jgi:hypothetical protein
MALGFLIDKGLAAVLGEDDSALERLVTGLGAPAEAAGHVRATLLAMPELMRAVDDALWAESTPREARLLWLNVVSYLVHDRDMVPATERDPILGLLDDTYLVHKVALELGPHLGPVDLRSVAGGVELLGSLLPRGVIRELDDRLAAAKREPAR